MKTKKSQPKMSGLVVAALRNLRDAHGSTAKEIMKYIMAEYNASEATVQRQLRTALKRGVEYGILKKTTAGYSLNTDAEVIGPLDLAQMDSCGKRRRKRHGCSMRRKRSACGMKKKRKRASCAPRRRRKKNPCGMCAARGRKGDCSATPVQLVHEGTPTLEEEAASNEANREAAERRTSRSRSRSTSRAKQTRNRSRSQSLAKSQYSGSDNEDDRQEDDMM